jgi:hypothetical protein
MAEETQTRVVQEKRAYRHPVHTLAYVRIDHGNGGIIRNLSETGLGIQAVGRLHPEQIVHLRFEFIRPKARFDIVGQVKWADASGQAGLAFVDPAPRTLRLLKDWLFTDLLIATAESASKPLLTHGEIPNWGDGLIMSAAPIAPIRLPHGSKEEPVDTVLPLHEQLANEMPLRFPWWPGDIRPRTFARLVDTLVVASAVLVFSIVVLQLTDILPSWTIAVPSLVVLVVVLALIYTGLFKVLLGRTLGWHLSQLAADDLSWLPNSTRDLPRFR